MKFLLSTVFFPIKLIFWLIVTIFEISWSVGTTLVSVVLRSVFGFIKALFYIALGGLAILLLSLFF